MAAETPNTMKAVGFRRSLPIEHPQALEDIEVDVPRPGRRDLLVRILAASVNPADAKNRRWSAPQDDGQNETIDASREYHIIGWDAAGIVEAVGSEVIGFTPGDTVYYSGERDRQGSNAQYQLVDERLAGHKPKVLSMPEAAAVPLTGVTAWECLEQLGILPAASRLPQATSQISAKADAQVQQKAQNKTQATTLSGSILIIAGAGGVGSMAIQLIKTLTNLVVIATASRESSTQWCKTLGADYVIPRQNIQAELKKLGMTNTDFILNLADTSSNWQDMAQIIAPRGRICSIVPPTGPVDLSLLFEKSASFSWELMFTRSSLCRDTQMAEQHHILQVISALYDSGQLQPVVGRVLRGLSATTLKEAHRLIEFGSTIGKIALEYI